MPVEWLTLLLRIEGQVNAIVTTLDRIDRKLDSHEQRLTALETWRTEIDTRLASVGWLGKIVAGAIGAVGATGLGVLVKVLGWG